MGSDDPIVEMRDGTALTSLALRGLGQAFPRSRLTLGQVKGRMRANEEGNPSKSVRPSAGDALVRPRPPPSGDSCSRTSGRPGPSAGQGAGNPQPGSTARTGFN